MTDDWSLLNGNPAPGQLDHVWAMGKFLEQSQLDAEQTQRELQALASGGDEIRWIGLAASAVRQALGRLAGPHLDVFASSYGSAASAVFTYAEVLQSMQALAQRLLVEAREDHAKLVVAIEREATARSSLSSASEQYDGAVASVKMISSQLQAADPTTSSDLSAQLAAAQSALAAARSALDLATSAYGRAQAAVKALNDSLAQLVRQADQVRIEITAAANRASTQLDQAASERVKQPNLIRRDIASIIEIEKLGAASPELEEYLRVLKDGTDVITTITNIINVIPVVKDNPIVKRAEVYAAVAVVGIDIVIMAGHEMQRWGGRTPDQGEWADLSDTAQGAVSAFMTVSGSKGIAGDYKRMLNYDDAREATGGWRSIAASPQLSAHLTSMFPGVSPVSIYRAATILETADYAQDAVDVYQAVTCPQSDDADTWELHDLTSLSELMSDGSEVARLTSLLP